MGNETDCKSVGASHAGSSPASLTNLDRAVERVRVNCKGRRVYHSLILNALSLDEVRAFRWRLPGRVDVLHDPVVAARLAEWKVPVSQLGHSQLLDRWHEMRRYDFMALLDSPGNLWRAREWRFDRRMLVYWTTSIMSSTAWASQFEAAEWKINDGWTDAERLHYVLESKW